MDYVKSLKKEIRDLKSQKGELNKQCIHLSFKLQETEKQLQKSRSKERKWYHFF
jgi:prefoldin subunit 5